MTSIFVAKLDFNTTDEQLKGLFEQYGKVNRVTIAKDKETGKPRGFAFVEMFNEQEAEAAIEGLDNSSVNGRTIAVKKADDRSSGGGKPQGGSPGGFNKSNDRPRGDFKPRGEFKPREDNANSGGSYKSDYKSNDEPKSPRPFSSDEIIQPKVDRTKKDKDPKAGLNKDAPKKNKMEAYKKSGKDNQFLDDDDLNDDELDLFGRNQEDDDDDDYRKYLVNSDDDSDDDYEDDDWDEDDDEDEDED